MHPNVRGSSPRRRRSSGAATRVSALSVPPPVADAPARARRVAARPPSPRAPAGEGTERGEIAPGARAPHRAGKAQDRELDVSRVARPPTSEPRRERQGMGSPDPGGEGVADDGRAHAARSCGPRESCVPPNRPIRRTEPNSSRRVRRAPPRRARSASGHPPRPRRSSDARGARSRRAGGAAASSAATPD